VPNGEFVVFDHPYLGLIPAIFSTHDIEANEEIFCHYGYNLENCPDWYESAWQNGNYPIPESMKDIWGEKGNDWAKDDANAKCDAPLPNGDKPDPNGGEESYLENNTFLAFPLFHYLIAKFCLL
jgi:hypothetical protein